MDHPRVSVMPHCIGLEGREAIDSTGASYGVIVWSAGRSRKLRENQLSGDGTYGWMILRTAKQTSRGSRGSSRAMTVVY